MTEFPISMAQPARFQAALPATCDVVIIGGGVIGVMTAWHLAARGLRVTLCEKGRIAAEQSSRNWGWIRQQGRDFAELPIMMESMAIWKALAAEIGTPLGFRQDGVMYLARSHAEMAGFAAWMDQARGHGLDAQLQSTGQILARMPGAAVEWVGGLFTASDARAEPWVTVPLLAAGAVRRGAVIVEGCAVRALDRQAGRVTGVVTERGRIVCDQVVLAGGAWSSLLLRAEGVIIPQLSVLASVAATVALPKVFAGNAADDRFAFRRRVDGGYTIAAGTAHDFYLGPDALRHFGRYVPVIGKHMQATRLRPWAPADYPDGWGTARRWSADEVSPFERQRVLDPAPNRKRLAAVQNDFARAFPGIGRPEIRQAWGGMIDTMPDMVPVVDRVAAVPGLVVATGMSGHGFGIGPGMGRVVADLVMGRAVGHDLSRFRLSRFSDGSKMELGAAL